MKVLFLSQIVPYPPHGGVLQRGYNIIREISKYNDVYLLAFIHPDILVNDELVEESRKELGEYCSNIEYFTLWPKKSKFHKYLGYFIGMLSRKPFSVIAHNSKSYSKRIDSLIMSGAVDIVHYDTIALAQYNLEKYKIPKVLTHHNIESKLMERRADVEKNPLAKKYLITQTKRLRKYEAEHSKKFDINLMMSEVDARELSAICPDVNCAVVPNGADTEYFIPRRGEEETAVIYTGGMNMYANKDAVIYFIDNIWRLIKSEIDDVIFYAVGQDPPSELLERSKEDNSIIITGYVDDVRPLVAKAAVYVVPLRVGGGTRLKVVDAMCQGKAIVSTSIGCEGIDVSNGKNIIIEDIPANFAAQVVKLIKNKTERDKLGDAARQLIESKYSWSGIGKNLQNIYEKIATI